MRARQPTLMRVGNLSYSLPPHMPGQMSFARRRREEEKAEFVTPVTRLMQSLSSRRATSL